MLSRNSTPGQKSWKSARKGPKEQRDANSYEQVLFEKSGTARQRRSDRRQCLNEENLKTAPRGLIMVINKYSLQWMRQAYPWKNAFCFVSQDARNPVDTWGDGCSFVVLILCARAKAIGVSVSKRSFLSTNFTLRSSARRWRAKGCSPGTRNARTVMA